jgi:hypothetical protein
MVIELIDNFVLESNSPTDYFYLWHWHPEGAQYKAPRIIFPSEPAMIAWCECSVSDELRAMIKLICFEHGKVLNRSVYSTWWTMTNELKRIAIGDNYYLSYMPLPKYAVVLRHVHDNIYKLPGELYERGRGSDPENQTCDCKIPKSIMAVAKLFCFSEGRDLLCDL